MTTSRLLIVAEEIPSATVDAIADCGIDVYESRSPADAVERWSEDSFDGLLGVPETSDVSAFVAELRDRFPDCPVVLSVPDDSMPKVEGILEPGVVDYVRLSDLQEHGWLVAHRIETVLAAGQQLADQDCSHESHALATEAANTLTAIRSSLVAIKAELTSFNLLT